MKIFQTVLKCLTPGMVVLSHSNFISLPLLRYIAPYGSLECSRISTRISSASNRCYWANVNLLLSHKPPTDVTLLLSHQLMLPCYWANNQCKPVIEPTINVNLLLSHKPPTEVTLSLSQQSMLTCYWATNWCYPVIEPQASWWC